MSNVWRMFGSSGYGEVEPLFFYGETWYIHNTHGYWDWFASQPPGW